MSDFTNACKVLGVTKCSKIAEFAEKRADKMKHDIQDICSQDEDLGPIVQYQDDKSDILQFDCKPRTNAIISLDGA